jgi:hypothetical protein
MCVVGSGTVTKGNLLLGVILHFFTLHSYVKVKQSPYRPGVAERVPESYVFQIT